MVAAKRAKAFVFVNGKLTMQKIEKIDKWINTKTFKPIKGSYSIAFDSKFGKDNKVVVDFTPAYISLFTARATHGLYLIISLFNPVFNKHDVYPIKTLAEAKKPENLVIPYA